jgi:vacuolar iron transporter family protein
MDAPVEAPRTLQDLKREHGVLLGSRHGQPQGEINEQSPLRNYVRDLVLGFNDGLVSVFAVTAGIAGAGLFTREQILVTGVAASIAGAFSMGAGEYISTKSQADFYRSERAREEEHLRKWPELERQELRESFAEKGIKPPLLDQVVDAIASDRNRFLEYMMRDEFGVGKESQRSPVMAAVYVILAFLLGAVFAVTPYAAMSQERALAGSAALSLAGLFVAGVVRARASRLPMVRAGFEMVLVGALAALVTYGVGRLVGVTV